MLETGDRFVVWRLDRMGRSLRHLIEINHDLSTRGVGLESLTEKIDTSTAMGNFVFQILGAVAELEREIIRERTLAGLAAAARKGRYPGRPAKRQLSVQMGLLRQAFSQSAKDVTFVAAN